MSLLSPLSPPDALDPSSTGPEPAIFTAIWLPTQLLFVSLRYYSRSINRVSWALDDILVLFSLALQIALGALVLDSYINGGLGHHFLYLIRNRPETASHYLLNNFTISILCIPASIIPRFAILILYHRIFPQSHIRLQIYILAIILGLFMAIYITVVCLMCIPIASNWDLNIKDYKCINVRAVQIWSSFPSLIIDLWMLILPVPVVWRLHAAPKLKLGLSLTFLVGSFGLVTAALRFAMFLLNHSHDRSRNAAHLLIWVQVESGCYLLSACLLVCKPVLDRSVRFWARAWKEGRLWGEWMVGRVRMAVPVRWRGDVSVVRPRGVGEEGMVGEVEVVKIEEVVEDSVSTKVGGGDEGAEGGRDLEAQMRDAD